MPQRIIQGSKRSVYLSNSTRGNRISREKQAVGEKSIHFVHRGCSFDKIVRDDLARSITILNEVSSEDLDSGAHARGNELLPVEIHISINVHERNEQMLLIAQCVQNMKCHVYVTGQLIENLK